MKETSVINNPEEHVIPEPEEPRPATSAVAPFRLQPDTQLDNVNSYALRDLLSYHDTTFVQNAYKAIAKREPSPSELTQTLHELRAGLRTKTEIIEELSGKNPNVRVDGLGSPALRRVSRWPIIGYLLTVLRAVGRLPLLVQHQQQFESYIVGQQQRMVDHVNDLSIAAGSEVATPQSELAENVSDAIQTVMMLSDSLIELSARLAEGETRLQALQAQHEKEESEFRNSLAALGEQLVTSARQLQTQHEQSEAQLHRDLVALTTQVTAQQDEVQRIRRDAEAMTTTQREFLIDEQRVIVEAQRAALSDLETQLSQSQQQHAAKIAELTAELHELRAHVTKFQEARRRK